MDDDNWWRKANCLRLPTELFYDYEKTQSRRVPDEAKDACRACPSKSECLIYALEWPELYGYWAGTTAGERRRIRASTKVPVER